MDLRLTGVAVAGLVLAVGLAFGRTAAAEEGGQGKNEVVDRNNDPHGPHAGQRHQNGTVDQGWHGGKPKHQGHGDATDQQGSGHKGKGKCHRHGAGKGQGPGHAQGGKGGKGNEDGKGKGGHRGGGDKGGKGDKGPDGDE